MKMNVMKKIFFKLMFLGMGFCAFSSYADDTDIYLLSDATQANPPFLMMMIDYRPSSFSTFCNNLTACVDDMSEAAFVQLCVNTSIITPNADPALDEELCRTYYKDVVADGLADHNY